MIHSVLSVLESHSSGYWGVGPGAHSRIAFAIRNGDIGTSGELRWDSLPLRGYTSAEFDRAKVKRGDIVMTTSGNCAEVAYIDRELEHAVVATNFVRILRVRRDLVDSRYLFHFLRSNEFRTVAAKHVRGATIKNLSTAAALEAAALPLPPLPAQRRIAGFLDEAVALRAARSKSLSGLSELRARVIDSIVRQSVGEQPLADLVPRIESGRSPVCRDVPAGGDDWGVLKLGSISTGRFLATENKALPTDVQPYESAEVHEGDVLMSRKNTIELVGASVYVETVRPRILMSDLIYRLPLKAGAPVSARYLQAYLSTDRARARIRAMAGGSAASMSNISKERLSRLPVPIPSRADRERLDIALMQLSDEERRMTSQAGEFEFLFASLEHRAFRGEL